MLRTYLPLPRDIATRLDPELPSGVLHHVLTPYGTSHLALRIIPGVKMAQLEAAAASLGDRVGQLQELRIGRGLNDEAGAKLGSWPVLEGISQLDLEGSKLSAAFVQAVTSGPCAKQLRHVRRTSMKAADLGPLLKIAGLHGLDVSPATKVLASSWIGRIEKAKALSQLRSLFTHGMLPDWDKALDGALGRRLLAFGVGGAGAWTAAQTILECAEELTLLDVRDAQAPMRCEAWPKAPKLTALSLDQNTLDEEAWDGLESWGVLPNLRCLNTAGGNADLAIERLVAHDDLQLETLLLSGWSASADALVRLAQWSGFGRLERLVLRSPKPEAFAAFVAAADFSSMKYFTLALDRDRGDAAANAAFDELLRSNPTTASLEHAV